ncbi:hypothetical protein CW705_01695 [Candidatus Bathyarchaeota archaeon]|nr:MAG: hypothetical protein CW705_01695 [Candidatus Bathyarchaeota archaeon]
MEFLILSSSLISDRKRERMIVEAVIEAAEEVGITRIVKRSCNVLSTGVYIVDGGEKKLVYNDWGKDWDQDEIYERIVSSVKTLNGKCERSDLVFVISKNSS